MLVRPPETPWENNYQRQSDEAFQRAIAPDAFLRKLKPPLPQIEYLPPRFGYPNYADRQWDVMQVFGITRTPSGQIPGMPRMRGKDRVDYTQSQSSSQGSDRNSGSNDALGMGAGGTA